MTVRMDETFAAGLRAALVSEVQAATRASRRRRARRVAAGLGGLAVIAAGTAVAATVLSGPPGSDKVTSLAPVVTFTGRGTQTVDMGQPPAGANRIELRLTCLTPGVFVFTDGASAECRADDVGRSVTTYSLPIAPGQHSTTIQAGAGQRWHLLAQYANATATSWGVNSDGHTYGVANGRGIPDLVAVIATNGRKGYVYAAQLQDAQPEPTSPAQAATMRPTHTAIPVYESDGHTVIGQFVIGNEQDR